MIIYVQALRLVRILVDFILFSEINLPDFLIEEIENFMKNGRAYYYGKELQTETKNS